jgi:hypothetical protein
MEGDCQLNPRKIILAPFDVLCNAQVAKELEYGNFPEQIG